jgi:hypothetical protein
MRYFGSVIAIMALIFLFAQAKSLNPAVSQGKGIELEILSAANASELQQIARYGNGSLTGAVAWSSDTETIAVGTTLGIWFYHLANLDEGRFVDFDTKIIDLVFLNEGQYLAYCIDCRHG